MKTTKASTTAPISSNRSNYREMPTTAPQMAKTATEQRPTVKAYQADVSATIPADVYPVKITAASDVVLSSGRDAIKLELEVSTGKFKGQKLFEYIADNETALPRIYDILKSCGATIPASITAESFLRLSGKVKTQVKQYRGQVRAAIAYWTSTPATPSHAESVLNPAQ